MNLLTANPEVERFASIDYLPAVSVVMPFSPVTTSSHDLDSRIKNVMGKIESMLSKNYPVQKAMPVIFKLKNILKNLNFYTHQKSVAVFISPVAEKVLYLNSEVEEKISIDASFRISEIVDAKKDQKEYLVFLLSDRFSKMFLGDSHQLKLTKSNTLVYTTEEEAIKGPLMRGVQGGLSLDKFLKQMDVGLSIMLKSYPLPVFTIGSQAVLDQFRQITRNDEYIVQYMQGNYDTATGCDLVSVVKQFINQWDKVRDRFYLNLVEKAKMNHHLSVGLKQSMQAALKNKAKLLVLERNYGNIINTSEIYNTVNRKYASFNPVFYIKDEVDELIEKVFDTGGDVAFVEDGVLKNYGQVAMIEAY